MNEQRKLPIGSLTPISSDNGAPIIDRVNPPPVSYPGGAWDGSLNTPLMGEKGMLTEGGIRVPFVAQWPGVIPPGMVYSLPVTSLDITATSLAAAGLPVPDTCEGVNLVPHLLDEQSAPPHPRLFWRFWSQVAVREGDWKFLNAGGREFLFNLREDPGETRNRIDGETDRAARLRAAVADWSSSLIPPGFDTGVTPNQLAAQTAAYEKYFPSK